FQPRRGVRAHGQPAVRALHLPCPRPGRSARRRRLSHRQLGAHVSFRTRAASLLAFVLLVLAAPLTLAPSASAASVGYIRLAHLSPDTPSVDVWLTSFRDKKF